MKKTIIVSKIDGKKHYWTGGISKQLPLFSTDKNIAYKYNDELNAETRLNDLIGKGIISNGEIITILI